MFEPLINLLPKSLRHHDLYDGVQASLLLKRVKQYYTGVLPEIEVHPFVVKRKKVIVKVGSSLLAGECHRFCEGCIEALHMEGFEIDGLQFRVGISSDTV